MGNFNKFDKSSNGRGFGSHSGGGRRFGGRSDGPRQMYPAICNQCGQKCEVPFKPTGERPVFCHNCFKSQGGPGGRFTPKNFDGGNKPVAIGSHSSGSTSAPGGTVSKAQFDSLNTKLDKILALLTATSNEETPNANGSEVKTKKETSKKVKNSTKKPKGKKK